MKVIRSADGDVINIGEWDFCMIQEIGPDGEESMVPMNPMPAGATESDEDVIEGWDGGFYVLGDQRAEGPAK